MVEAKGVALVGECQVTANARRVRSTERVSSVRRCCTRPHIILTFSTNVLSPS